MPSMSDSQRAREARLALVRAGRFASNIVRVHCDVCGILKGGQGTTTTGALDHARLRPGHNVTVSTLQMATYGLPAEGENTDVRTPRGHVTPNAKSPTWGAS